MSRGTGYSPRHRRHRELTERRCCWASAADRADLRSYLGVVCVCPNFAQKLFQLPNPFCQPLRLGVLSDLHSHPQVLYGEAEHRLHELLRESVDAFEHSSCDLREAVLALIESWPGRVLGDAAQEASRHHAG